MSDIEPWLAAYISIPYEEVDCYGLVRLIYKERLDIELEEVITSPIIFDNWKVVFEGVGEPVVSLYDVLMFKDDNVNRHVGIVVDDIYMLHTIRGVNSCLERWGRLNWRGRLKKVYRHHSQL